VRAWEPPRLRQLGVGQSKKIPDVSEYTSTVGGVFSYGPS
jgi:hypothetical protein